MFQSFLTFSGSRLNVAVQVNCTDSICHVLRKTHWAYPLYTFFPGQICCARQCPTEALQTTLPTIRSLWPFAAQMRLAGSFPFFPAGVQLILGLNGVIWVSAETTPAPEAPKPSMDSDAQPPTVRNVSQAERHAIARVAKCIRALAKLFFSIHPTSILNVYTVCPTCCLP